MSKKFKCCEDVSQQTIKRILHPILGQSLLNRCINCDTYFFNNYFKKQKKTFPKNMLLHEMKCSLCKRKWIFDHSKVKNFL